MLRLQARRGLKADIWEGGALNLQQIKAWRRREHQFGDQQEAPGVYHLCWPGKLLQQSRWSLEGGLRCWARAL